MRHEYVRQGSRNHHPAGTFGSRFLSHHVSFALTLASGDHLPGWIFMGFLLSQQPESCFGKVPRHRANSDGMTFSLEQHSGHTLQRLTSNAKRHALTAIQVKIGCED
jgi:hypothetical protein